MIDNGPDDARAQIEALGNSRRASIRAARQALAVIVLGLAAVMGLTQWPKWALIAKYALIGIPMLFLVLESANIVASTLKLNRALRACPIQPPHGFNLPSTTGSTTLVASTRLMNSRDREILRTYESASTSLQEWITKFFVNPSNQLHISRTHYREDNRQGEVEILNGVVQNLVVGEEWNNEGPIFLLHFGGNDWLWLCGQWLFDRSIVDQHLIAWFKSHDENVWPRQVRVERLRASGLVVSLGADTTSFTAAAKIIPTDRLFYLGQSCRFSGSMDSIESDLSAAFHLAKTRDPEKPGQPKNHVRP